MIHMPNFIQSAVESTRHHPPNAEAEFLKHHSREKLSNLLANNNLAAPPSLYQARLETELRIIEDNEFCNYFLIVADYVQWARDNGIAVGPGRGSGPCSLVGFALGITLIDPIKYDLPFERFVNPDRNSLPDFDLEFCDERRDEVIRYIQSTYGDDRVAQISSDDATPLPSRLVICDRPLAGLVDIYTNPESGFPTTKTTLGKIGSVGLVQFNAINRKALTVIQRTVQEIEKSGEAIDIDNIPLDDNSTYHLLSAGEVSYVDSPDKEIFRSTLLETQPDHFNELCAVTALCHPTLQCRIQSYIDRKQNPETASYFHPALIDITKETYGLILYQEQLMHIAQKIAEFSFAQGDLLRRALQRSNVEAICIYKNRFTQGAIKFGMSPVEATDLFKHIELFGQRYFNKSHAVAFATTAYQTAWLKTNYSRHFKTVN